MQYLIAMGVQPWQGRVVSEFDKHIIDRSELVRAIDDGVDIQATEEQQTSKIQISATIDAAIFEDKKSETARFKLGFVVFREAILVTDLPFYETESMSVEQYKLISAIGFSVGFVQESGDKPLVMKWPLVQNSQVDQSGAAAFQAVQAQLKKQIEKNKPSYVIVMGSSASRYVLGSEYIFDNIVGQLITTDFLVALVTRSVAELLKVPSLKNDVWRDLQIIRKH